MKYPFIDTIPAVLKPHVPSVYTGESFTVLEYLSRVAGKINDCINEFNAFSEDIAKLCEEHINECKETDDLFQRVIEQRFADFINTIKLKCDSQDLYISERFNEIEGIVDDKEEAITQLKNEISNQILDFNITFTNRMNALVQHTETLKNKTDQNLSKVQEIVNNFMVEGLPSVDWEQNDETQPDYVKNRTHWKEPGEESITLFERTISFKSNVQGITGLNDSKIVEGKQYVVTWNDVEYISTCIKDGSHLEIGGNTYPFLISDIIGDGTAFITKTTSTAEDISVKIETLKTEDVYHKLPIEYLPDGIGGVNADPVIFNVVNTDTMELSCTKTFNELTQYIAKGNSSIYFSYSSYISTAICVFVGLNELKFSFYFDGNFVTIRYNVNGTITISQAN